ncbi:MAG: YqgE/AlgH family protein [Rhodospirillaceae bacterium]|nr:YqgE/AlgH family protein [Rhodospirillaceae bacterium]
MKPSCLVLLAWLAATPSLAQAPAQGMLLVATPEMRDPRFSRTVVLLLHYEAEGALGVAINRPTWVTPSAAFPQMDFLQDYRGNVYVGGPMARANVLVLVRDPEIDVPDTEPVFDDVYLSTDPEFVRGMFATAGDERRLRLYAGHARWSAGQLDGELSAGHWQVVPATADVVFASDPLEVWGRLRARGSEMSVSVPSAESGVAALP